MSTESFQQLYDSVTASELRKRQRAEYKEAIMRMFDDAARHNVRWAASRGNDWTYLDFSDFYAGWDECIFEEVITDPGFVDWVKEHVAPFRASVKLEHRELKTENTPNIEISWETD